MSEQNQTIALELTIQQCELIRKVITIASVLEGLIDFTRKEDLAVIEDKISAQIGDPLFWAKRNECESTIRQYFPNDPTAKNNLEEMFPLPPAYRL
jgi:hypothetical protein